jgi:hypothetical protein
MRIAPLWSVIHFVPPLSGKQLCSARPVLRQFLTGMLYHASQGNAMCVQAMCAYILPVCWIFLDDTPESVILFP